MCAVLAKETPAKQAPNNPIKGCQIFSALCYRNLPQEQENNQAVFIISISMTLADNTQATANVI